jgi:hypothetical protein
MFASGPDGTAGEADPAARLADPRLHQSQAERLRLAGALDLVDHDRGEHRRVAGERHLGLLEPLRAPHEIGLGVGGDVGVAVQDRAAVRRPPQRRVVERAQRVRVPRGERFGAAARGGEDLVLDAATVLSPR